MILMPLPSRVLATSFIIQADVGFIVAKVQRSLHAWKNQQVDGRNFDIYQAARF
jgi:hypothetical protein